MWAEEGAQTPPLPLQPHPGFEPRAGEPRIHDPRVGQMKVSKVGQIRLSNAVLSRALGAAEQWEYINDNQARKTRLPRRPLRLAPRPVLAPEQIRQLAAKLAEPARSIAVLLVLTGLRVGELLALRWKNIDLAGRTLRVTETVYDGHFDTPKTQRSNRVIPIGDEASSVLRALCDAPIKPEDLVFATQQGQPLSRHNVLRRQLRPACKKLGLHGITWHSLRHSHATLLDSVGAPSSARPLHI
jgi:integrase